MNFVKKSYSAVYLLLVVVFFASCSEENLVLTNELKMFDSEWTVLDEKITESQSGLDKMSQDLQKKLQTMDSDSSKSNKRFQNMEKMLSDVDLLREENQNLYSIFEESYQSYTLWEKKNGEGEQYEPKIEADLDKYENIVLKLNNQLSKISEHSKNIAEIYQSSL